MKFGKRNDLLTFFLNWCRLELSTEKLNTNVSPFISISIVSACIIYYRFICHLLPFHLPLNTNDAEELEKTETKTMNFEPSSSCARLKKYYFWIIRLSLCSPISLVVRSRTQTQSTRNDNNALLLNRKGKKNRSDTKTVVPKCFGKAILKRNEREDWNYEEKRNWSNAFATTASPTDDYTHQQQEEE